MNNLPNCPKCNSEYVYEDGSLLVCPECAYEWNPAEVAEVEEGVVAIDANGNKLADGDTVTLIKVTVSPSANLFPFASIATTPSSTSATSAGFHS